MAKYPALQREQIRTAIIDCNIRRMTLMETHQHLRDMGIEISVPTVKNYRSLVRYDAQNWISKLAKSKRNDYIAQYRERVYEVMGLQRELWKIAKDDKTGPRTKVEAAGKLLDCTKQLIELYDSLPLVNAIRDYDALQEHRGTSTQPTNSGTDISRYTD